MLCNNGTEVNKKGGVLLNTAALNDFISYSKVNDSVINKFKNIIPKTLISIWEKHGLGTFMNGYIKVINPDDYQSIVDSTCCTYKKVVPIFVTAFGDIITLESGEYIGILYYRYGKFELLLKDFDFFLSRLTDRSFVNEFFSLNQYYRAINEHGMLLYKECFGDTTLLALGGKHTTESLKKVQIQEHIALINSYSGTIM